MLGAAKGGSKAGARLQNPGTAFCSVAPTLEESVPTARGEKQHLPPPRHCLDLLLHLIFHSALLNSHHWSWEDFHFLPTGQQPPPGHPRRPRTAAAGKDTLWWFSSVAVPSPGYGLLYEIQMYAERPRVHCKPFQGTKKKPKPVFEAKNERERLERLPRNILPVPR